MTTPKLDAPATSSASNGSAIWHYSQGNGVNMWTWAAPAGVRYLVTQHRAKVQAHVSTGTAYKRCWTIGDYATVKEAKIRCEEHWQNAKVSHSARPNETKL